MTKPSQPIDDDFARALESRHDLILKGKAVEGKAVEGKAVESAIVPPQNESGERIESAVEVLKWLAEYDAARDRTANVEETEKHEGVSTAREGTAWVPESVFFELTSLGRFKIRESIGRGGFGVVFRAFDPDLKREVAIKISRWDLASAGETRQRFQREAIAAAGLNHPGIVRVHEVDSERGLDYIVTELVDGKNLAAHLASGRRFGIRESAQIVRDVADALEHAHQRGVLHRDLKPANVLLPDQTTSQCAGPKISDFGLAVVQGQTDLTRTGAMVGTPEYMSPEQAAGHSDQIGPETDVYALGGILYCLLAGRSPFAGNNLLKTLAAIKSQDPVAPSRWNAEVPRDLDAICLKCLEKQPSNRYLSARDLQADLNRFLEGQPVVARRVTEPERFVRWCRRNPLTSTLSASLLIGLVVGLIAVGYLWRVSETNFRQAELNQQKFIRKSEQLTSAVDRLFVSLANHPEIRQASADGLRRTLLQEAYQFKQIFLQESPEDPELVMEFARSMTRLADIYAHLGDYRASLELLQNAIELVIDQQPIQIDDRELIEWWIDRAEVETHLGEFQQANRSFGRAAEIGKVAELSSPDDQQFWVWQNARIQIDRARSLLHQEQHRQAETEAAEAQVALLTLEQAGNPLAHQHREQFHWNRGLCHFILAQANRLKGKFNDAIPMYQAALSDFATVAESTLESDGLQYDQANCLSGLGLAWAEQKQPEQAVEFYRRSLASITELVNDHPQVEIFRKLQSSVQYSLAANRMVVGNYAEFRELIQANIDEKKRLIDEFPDAQAKYYGSLGDAYNLVYFGLSREGTTSGDELIKTLLRAKSAFDQAIVLNPDWNRPQMAACRVESNLGIEYAKQNDWERAKQYLADAIDRINIVLRDQPKWAEAIDQRYSFGVNQIYVLEKTGDFEGAIEQAEDLLREHPDHQRAYSLRLGQAKLLAEARGLDAACKHLESVCDQYARAWKDFGDAADKVMQLSELAGEDAADESDDLSELAVQFLNAAVAAHPQSREALLDWVRSQPRLAELAEQLNTSDFRN